MIVQDFNIDMGCPLSIVDHPSFLRLMNTIDPRFTFLSGRTLCHEALLSALERVMTKVKQACADAKFVALILSTRGLRGECGHFLESQCIRLAKRMELSRTVSLHSNTLQVSSYRDK
jgi:hypothetical protein